MLQLLSQLLLLLSLVFPEGHNLFKLLSGDASCRLDGRVALHAAQIDHQLVNIRLLVHLVVDQLQQLLLLLNFGEGVSEELFEGAVLPRRNLVGLLPLFSLQGVDFVFLLELHDPLFNKSIHFFDSKLNQFAFLV